MLARADRRKGSGDEMSARADSASAHPSAGWLQLTRTGRARADPPRAINVDMPPRCELVRPSLDDQGRIQRRALGGGRVGSRAPARTGATRASTSYRSGSFRTTVTRSSDSGRSSRHCAERMGRSIGRPRGSHDELHPTAEVACRPSVAALGCGRVVELPGHFNPAGAWGAYLPPQHMVRWVAWRRRRCTCPTI